VSDQHESNSQGITVAELVESYIRLGMDELAPESVRLRLLTLRAFVESFGTRPTSSLKAVEFLTWLKNPAWKSGWTIKRIQSTIKRLFNWGLEMDLVPVNPFARVRCRGNHKGRRQPMGDQHFQAILRHVEPGFRRFLIFLKFTGCRPKEAWSTRWKDVHLESHAVILSDHKTAKVTGRPRLIPLVPIVIKLLVWMKQHRQVSAIGLVERFLLENGGRMKMRDLAGRMRSYGIGCEAVINARWALGVWKDGDSYILPADHVKLDDPKESDFVFVNSRGGQFSRSSLVQRMNKCRKRAGLPKSVTLYGLRHRYGLMGIKNGTNLKLLSLCMGHTRTQQTEDYISAAGLTEDVHLAALQIAYGPGAVAKVKPPPPPRLVDVVTPPPAEEIPTVMEYLAHSRTTKRPRPQVPIDGSSNGNKLERVLDLILQKLAPSPRPPRRRPRSVMATNANGESAPRRQLRPAHVETWKLYQWALEQNPALVKAKDADVYAWLMAYADPPGKLPPSFVSFSRYLGRARLFYGVTKRPELTGRPTADVPKPKKGKQP
jgi:integrase